MVPTSDEGDMGASERACLRVRNTFIDGFIEPDDEFEDVVNHRERGMKSEPVCRISGDRSLPLHKLEAEPMKVPINPLQIKPLRSVHWAASDDKLSPKRSVSPWVRETLGASHLNTCETIAEGDPSIVTAQPALLPETLLPEGSWPRGAGLMTAGSEYHRADHSSMGLPLRSHFYDAFGDADTTDLRDVGLDSRMEHLISASHAGAEGYSLNLVDPAAAASPQQEFPSQGSLSHYAGGCEPCAWFWKPVGCRNGRECHRCHLCPDGEVRVRRKMKTTMLREGLRRTSAAAPAGRFGGRGGGGVMDVSAPLGLGGEESNPLATYKWGTNSSDDDTTAPESPLAVDKWPKSMPLPQKVPQNTPRNPGSLKHDLGTCEPCAWFWRPEGCLHGEECGRCHKCPEGEVKVRRREKLARMRAQAKQAKTGRA